MKKNGTKARIKKAMKLTDQTRRKVRVIGVEEYINRTTGEIEEMGVLKIEERDANFHKIWLKHIVTSLDIIGNQKIRFALWLIEHMNKENQVIMTLRQMQEQSGISLQTVQRTITALIDSGFLKRINQGAYCVNPDVIFKGGKSDRLNILLRYRDIEKKEKTKKETDEVESHYLPGLEPLEMSSVSYDA